MSHGYSATPLWGPSRNSAVAGIFRENLSAAYSAHLVPCVEQSFTKIAKIQCEKFSGFQI